jgi:PAS domain-containing protein
MSDHAWIKSFPGAITVCDAEGIILELNQAACEVFRQDGGEKLIGTNLFACHPEPARLKLQALMAQRQTSVYTIEKGGKKKLIYQTPWYQDGQYAGFVELSLVIPEQMPHFIRQ